MRKVDVDSQPSIRIRRRDTAIVATMGSLVLVLFWLFGELGFVETFVAITTFAGLSTFYYLTVSTTLNASSMPSAVRVAHPTDAVAASADVMLQHLPIPVMLIGPGGRIEMANPAAREFLGLGALEGHLSSVLRQPRVIEAVGAALQGEKVQPVEYATLAPVESHVRAIIAPIQPTGDSVPHWRAMLVLADETSIKRADRMRADFLANASHELRTPLTSLAGFIETLRGHAKDDPEARERFLAIMFDQTERMSRLINDLLSLSRIEMDEHVPPIGDVDLTVLAGEVIALLGPQTADKKIVLSLEAPEPARVVGDRDQLMEVLQNLIENAIKYAPVDSGVLVRIEPAQSRDQVERPAPILGDDAGRLTLAAPKSGPGERYIAVRVRDSGPGIKRRDLLRLSERFYRVSGQKSGASEGTGLGLAIVKHIVNRHRGGLTVESVPGGGSVFSVFFPTVTKAGVEADRP
ncbi:ATP-binding protein [uncultured Maricaulis sp.]|uniref:sensor histidine kinase n=1 Tax=uncultured Maricaulis sp. TaxID=174710 RepID=UPI0030D819C3